MNTTQAVAFLREASRNFSKRAVLDGEDAAFWANVHNAENCGKIADLIERMEATQASQSMMTPSGSADGENQQRESVGIPEVHQNDLGRVK